VQNSVVSMASLPDVSRTPPTPEEIALLDRRVALVSSYLAQGVPPDEVGRMVLSGVKGNRLYILTDRIMLDGITARTKALLAAMPSGS